jgi:hypothetical protein
VGNVISMNVTATVGFLLFSCVVLDLLPNAETFLLYLYQTLLNMQNFPFYQLTQLQRLS